MVTDEFSVNTWVYKIRFWSTSDVIFHFFFILPYHHRHHLHHQHNAAKNVHHTHLHKTTFRAYTLQSRTAHACDTYKKSCLLLIDMLVAREWKKKIDWKTFSHHLLLSAYIYLYIMNVLTTSVFMVNDDDFSLCGAWKISNHFVLAWCGCCALWWCSVLAINDIIFGFIWWWTDHMRTHIYYSYIPVAELLFLKINVRT